MDLVASPRCPPPWEVIPHGTRAERCEPRTYRGESENPAGGRPAKTPPPGKGAKREGRAARRETGGDSKAAPESTTAIYTANRSIIRRSGAGPQGATTASRGTRQSRGASRRSDTAASNRTCFPGCAGRHGDTTASRRRRNGAANHTSRPGCAGPAASGTGGTGKTSLPAVHQKDPSRTAAKEEGRDDRRTSGLHLPATLASRSDPQYEGTRHDPKRVVLWSPTPLPAAATLQQ